MDLVGTRGGVALKYVGVGRGDLMGDIRIDGILALYQ